MFVLFVESVLSPSSMQTLKPATGRPYVRAFSLSGTVRLSAFCLRIYATTKVDLCVSTYSRTMLALRNNVSFSSSECSTLAFCRR